MIRCEVNDILAAQALDQPSIAPPPEISAQVQRRLDELEKKIEGKDDSRQQGLTFLLMAKQHTVRGEYGSALQMYALAKDYFPDNERLEAKMEKCRRQLQERKQADAPYASGSKEDVKSTKKAVSHSNRQDWDDEKHELHNEDGQSRGGKGCGGMVWEESAQTPRTRMLLRIVNSGDKAQIRRLKGVGSKKAEVLMEAFAAHDGSGPLVRSLLELSELKGVGVKAVEGMREGLSVMS